jgi:Tfp pilus assembly protein PilE
MYRHRTPRGITIVEPLIVVVIVCLETRLSPMVIETSVRK